MDWGVPTLACDEEADATADANHKGQYKTSMLHKQCSCHPYAEIDNPQRNPKSSQGSFSVSHGIKHVRHHCSHLRSLPNLKECFSTPKDLVIAINSLGVLIHIGALIICR